MGNHRHVPYFTERNPFCDVRLTQEELTSPNVYLSLRVIREGRTLYILVPARHHDAKDLEAIVSSPGEPEFVLLLPHRISDKEAERWARPFINMMKGKQDNMVILDCEPVE